jgi:hypothetical protein
MRALWKSLAAIALVALMSAPTFAQRGNPPNHANASSSGSGESHGW